LRGKYVPKGRIEEATGNAHWQQDPSLILARKKRWEDFKKLHGITEDGDEYEIRKQVAARLEKRRATRVMLVVLVVLAAAAIAAWTMLSNLK
jgi:hypothetical protein